jgi:hypothetical protein
LLYTRRVKEHTKRHSRPRIKLVHYWRLRVGTDIGAVQLQPYVTGPTQSVGYAGQQITIAGSGFSDASAVYFGSQSVKHFKVLNDTTIAVTVPTGSGEVSISVVTPAGLSANGPDDEFTYVTRP